VAFTSEAEVEILSQHVLDIEVHLKTENKNKCLRMQVLALEEHAANEFSKLRQSQPKLKNSGSNSLRYPEGVPLKNNCTTSKSPCKSAKPLPFNSVASLRLRLLPLKLQQLSQMDLPPP